MVFAGSAALQCRLCHPERSEGSKASTGSSVEPSGPSLRSGRQRMSGTGVPRSQQRNDAMMQGDPMAEPSIFPKTKRIGFVVFDDFEPLDVFGFVEAFSIARYLGKGYDDPPPYPF